MLIEDKIQHYYTLSLRYIALIAEAIITCLLEMLYASFESFLFCQRRVKAAFLGVHGERKWLYGGQEVTF